MLILVFAILVTGCGRTNEPEALRTNKIERTDSGTQQSFEITSEDITKVNISTGPNDKVTAVIEKNEDIALLTQILNTATPLAGDATADYYRLLTIKKKNGRATELEFGGNGWFFKSLETSVFWELPPIQQEKLRALLEKLKAAH